MITVGDLFGESSSDDSSDSDDSDDVAALEAAVKPQVISNVSVLESNVHSRAESRVTAVSIVLTEEELALKPLPRIQILFRKLNSSTIASLGEMLKTISCSNPLLPDAVSNGFADFLISRVKEEDTRWLSAERVDQSEFTKDALLPAPLISTMEDLYMLLTYIATSDSQGFQVAVNSLKQLINRVKAAAKSSRLGPPLLWAYIGADAVGSARELEPLLKSNNQPTANSNTGSQKLDATTEENRADKNETEESQENENKKDGISGDYEESEVDPDDDDLDEEKAESRRSSVKTPTVAMTMQIFLCEILSRLVQFTNVKKN